MSNWKEWRKAEKQERRRKADWERQIRQDERIRIQEREWAAGAPERRARDDAKKQFEAERELDARVAYVDQFGPRNAFLLTLAKWTAGAIVLAVVAQDSPAESRAMVILVGIVIGLWRGVSVIASTR